MREAWYFNNHFPWLGMAICAPVIGLWYWCTDQYIVQRALGAPNEQGGPPGQHLRRLPQALSGLSVHHPRPDLLRLVHEVVEPELTGGWKFTAADMQEKTFPLLARKLQGQDKDHSADKVSQFVWGNLSDSTRQN